jgi:hypothetical protein
MRFDLKKLNDWKGKDFKHVGNFEKLRTRCEL